MNHYRKISIGEDVPDAVTIGIERNPDGTSRAAVWWPSKGDMDADEVSFDSVDEAFQAAEAARSLHGFAEVVVALQSDELWQPKWGTLDGKIALSDDEAFELARATEAMRDA